MQYVHSVLGTEPDGGSDESAASHQLGVSRLRGFLEGAFLSLTQILPTCHTPCSPHVSHGHLLGGGSLVLAELLRERYLANLGSIVPQLQQACNSVGEQVGECDAALSSLTPEKLRALCGAAAQRFAQALSTAVRGAATDTRNGNLGQTLREEEACGGGSMLRELAPSSACEAVRQRVEGADASLFGGAQYHRLLEAFQESLKALPQVQVTSEELANAMGVDAKYDRQRLNPPTPHPQQQKRRSTSLPR